MGGGEAERDAEVLAAAAHAVLTTFRRDVEQKQLPGAAVAALRLLSAALERYRDSHSGGKP